MTVPQLDYQMVDADNHYYEPDDCFSRYLDRRFTGRTVRIDRTHGGPARVFLGDEPLRFLPELPTDAAGTPGAIYEVLKGRMPMSELARRHDAHQDPATMNRDARLALMDEQHLEAAVLLPSLAVAVENQLRGDVEALYANIRSFNRWLNEDWGFSYQGRLFSVAVLSLMDLESAVMELDQVLKDGARLVYLQQGPVNGRSPGDPYFDPFWARLNDARVPVIFHVGDSGYIAQSAAWSEDLNATVDPGSVPGAVGYSAFQHYGFFVDRPIMDTLAALVLHNLFGRHPELRVLSIENGSAWLPYLLQKLDKAKVWGFNGPWLGGRFSGKPSEIFREHIYVAPYPEEDKLLPVQVLGADRVLFGSDYPHAEGVARPIDFAEDLTSLPPADLRKIMRDNCAVLVKLGA